jgi:exonuclease SbcC
LIERLKSLEMNDFRVFSGRHDIPLDADAILIHGNNGTGKSSLLYAIEFSLTGEVADLKGFTHDYPRCLRHVDGTGLWLIRINLQHSSGRRGRV